MSEPQRFVDKVFRDNEFKFDNCIFEYCLFVFFSKQTPTIPDLLFICFFLFIQFCDLVANLKFDIVLLRYFSLRAGIITDNK